MVYAIDNGNVSSRGRTMSLYHDKYDHRNGLKHGVRSVLAARIANLLILQISEITH